MFDTQRLDILESNASDSVSGSAKDYNEVLSGLRASTPHVSPKWLYDDLGSALFEAITRVPEYYPTRCELEILTTYGDEMGEKLPRNLSVVELGSGSAQKIGRLLPQLREPRLYCPIDVSKAALKATVTDIGGRYPKLPVRGAQGDFSDPTATATVFRKAMQNGPILLFFPGSTLGNFEPRQAQQLLRGCAQHLPEGTPFLLGVDLIKTPELLEAAYDDAAGVTAAFNRNLLAHLNRRFDADFNLRRWFHEARWIPKKQRIEMWLRSCGEQRIRFGKQTLVFADEEGIHTENSHKWDRISLEMLAQQTGWKIDEWWTDRNEWFAEVLLTRLN